MPDINQFAAGGGRKVKEDNSVVNIADLIDALHKAFVVNKDAGMQLTGSGIAQPVDIQARLSQTIQTHNGVTIAPNGNNTGLWIDCDGYSDFALTVLNDALTNNTIDIHWSNDAVSLHGSETVAPISTSRFRSGTTPVKARYGRIVPINNDSTTPHVMSAWAYLKA